MYSKLLFFSLFTLIANAQLEVTPDGIKSNNKDYHVINIEGKDATDLYDKSLKYINSLFEVEVSKIKTSDNNYIKFTTYDPTFVRIKASAYKSNTNATYITELNFKDGKIKYKIHFQSIIIEQHTLAGKMNRHIEFSDDVKSCDCFPIYNEKDKLKRKKYKESIEKDLNQKLTDYISYLNTESSENKDDW